MSSADAIPVLERLIPGLAAVYLFGSEARGDARTDSDMDLAIVALGPVPEPVLRAAREAVEAAVNRDVDLVDLTTASTILAAQVMFEGRRIATLAPMVADLLEVRLMRDYVDLKARRRGIEDDIAKRGRVLAA